jgi:hypothetical protein
MAGENPALLLITQAFADSADTVPRIAVLLGAALVEVADPQGDISEKELQAFEDALEGLQERFDEIRSNFQ